MSLVVEFTIEPFVQGAPGPHVTAATEAAAASGFSVDFGPFGSRIRGDDDAQVLGALDQVVRAAMAAGATRVAVQVDRQPVR